MNEKECIEWLKQKRKMCEISMENCSQRINMLREDMETIDNLLSMIEGQQGNTAAAQQTMG